MLAFSTPIYPLDNTVVSGQRAFQMRMHMKYEPQAAAKGSSQLQATSSSHPRVSRHLVYNTPSWHHSSVVSGSRWHAWL